MRRKIIKIIGKCGELNKACFLNSIAKELKISHVGAKKHLDFLSEENYIEGINPQGKPVYLKLTKKGEELYREFKK